MVVSIFFSIIPNRTSMYYSSFHFVFHYPIIAHLGDLGQRRAQEQFIAAARVIAEIISLVKYSGIELWEAIMPIYIVGYPLG